MSTRRSAAICAEAWRADFVLLVTILALLIQRLRHTPPVYAISRGHVTPRILVALYAG
ncbi:MAG TPA: hypothetical protein VGO69_07150 [Pyrinomonadaceae bacterium]|nr:hypothetical protein [Pyrinomonadaceae bacterium]